MKVNTDKPDVKNSENTALFLLSCYQYILSAIVLSVGPPFRQSMARNSKCILVTHIGVTNKEQCPLS